jgi:chromate transporter
LDSILVSAPELAYAATVLPPVLELAAVFLRLGLTAFGGPAAHVALMEAEVVRRRRWISSERFLDLFGAANLLPGPSSSELAIFIGYERAGLLGLVLAGVCFILPAALLAVGLAAAYVRFGALPQVSGLLYGVKPVIIAIVAQAIWGLLPKALKSRTLVGIGLAATVASACGIDALAVFVAAGALAVVSSRIAARGNHVSSFAALLGPTALGSASPITLLGIFGVFLKLGAVVFGSGYVLVAFLREDLVNRLHWLTERQLLDAVAVGQVTPGPVFSTATFIGYLLAGPLGAVLATIAIFLPGFVFVALGRPLLARVRRSAIASVFLDGVNAAALAVMCVATAQLARTAVVDALTAVLIIAAAGALRWKINSVWLIAGGALVGIARAWFGHAL